MSLLQVATLENATGEVKEILQEIQGMFGQIPDGIQLWSVNPEALKMQWNAIKKVLSKDEDTQKLHAIIRYLMSEKNSCKYCTGFNASMLLNMFKMSEEDLKALDENLDVAKLNTKNMALLKFAMQSVKNPDSVGINDINSLKELEISEKEIFDIVHTASHMFAVNTLFRTFKV